MSTHYNTPLVILFIIIMLIWISSILMINCQATSQNGQREFEASQITFNNSNKVEPQPPENSFNLSLNEKLKIKNFYQSYLSKPITERIRVIREECNLPDNRVIFLRELLKLITSERLVLIQGGNCIIGKNIDWQVLKESSPPSGLIYAQPAHNVYINSFYMSKFEITNEQYFIFSIATKREQPEYWRLSDGDGTIAGIFHHPVVEISWFEAKAFADWVEMRLPYEAEWEYACKAGSNSRYFFGDNSRLLEEYAWFFNNSGWGKTIGLKNTHTIGTKKPNKWGLYDMYGNAGEWCYDWFDEDYYSESPKKNPKGPDKGKERVWRGGSYGSSAEYCVSALRSSSIPSEHLSSRGFRVVMDCK